MRRSDGRQGERASRRRRADRFGFVDRRGWPALDSTRPASAGRETLLPGLRCLALPDRRERVSGGEPCGDVRPVRRMRRPWRAGHRLPGAGTGSRLRAGPAPIQCRVVSPGARSGRAAASDDRRERTPPSERNRACSHPRQRARRDDGNGKGRARPAVRRGDPARAGGLLPADRRPGGARVWCSDAS